MTLDEFVKKYDGQPIDFDGNYGPQCVDLYRQYVKEVLGYPQSPPVVGAKDIWDAYLPEYFKRIENTPTGVPEEGDVVIFGTTLGKYGHVSIFLEGTTTKFTSFDQNYPTGTPCHKQGHTYSAVIGWLTPLQKPMDIPNYLKTLLQEANIDINNEGQFRAFWEKAIKYDNEVNSLKNQIISTNEALAQRATEVSALTEANQKLSDQKDELQEALNKERDKCDKATWEATQLNLQVKSLTDDNLILEKELNLMKSQNDIYAYSWWTRLKSLFK